MFWLAFWELCSDRNIGMAEGPIPAWAIREWCRDWALDDEESEYLKAVVKRMDKEYITYRDKQRQHRDNK